MRQHYFVSLAAALVLCLPHLVFAQVVPTGTPTLTVTQNPAFSSLNVSPGTINMRIASFVLTAGTAEELELTSMTVTIPTPTSNNSVAANFSNLKMMDDATGDFLGETQGTLTDGGQVSFSLDMNGTPLIMSPGESVIVDLLADVNVSGSSSTFASSPVVTIQPNSVFAQGVNGVAVSDTPSSVVYGQSVTITSAVSATPVSSTTPTLIIAQNPAVSALTITPGTYDTKVASFTVTAGTASNVALSDVTVNISSANSGDDVGANFMNLRMMDETTGQQIGQTQATLADGSQVVFNNSSITIPAGQTQIIELDADVGTNGGGASFLSAPVVSIQAGEVNAEDTENGQIISDTPSYAVYGQNVAVGSAAGSLLSVVQNVAASNFSVNSDTTAAKIASFSLTASTTSSVEITNLTVTIPALNNGNDVAANFQNLRLVNDNNTGLTLAGPISTLSDGGQTTFTFSSPVTISAGTTYVLDVEADVDTAGSGSAFNAAPVLAIAANGVNAVNMATGIDMANTPSYAISGQNVTIIPNGSLMVTQNPALSSLTITPGTFDTKVASFELTAGTAANVELSGITATISAANTGNDVSADFANLKLIDETTGQQIGQTQATLTDGSQVTFNNASVTIPAGQSHVIEFDADVGTGSNSVPFGAAPILSIQPNEVNAEDAQTGQSISNVPSYAIYGQNVIVATAAPVVSPVAPTPAPVTPTNSSSTITVPLSQLQSGDLIRGESFATVYYYGADGFRYVFPNQATYFTWYSNFSTVKIISDDDLGKIQIGGNVTYKPGVRMLKIASDPRTYVVAADGTLRWVSTEQDAVTLYGSNWNKYVDDLPDDFFFNYTLGVEIDSGLDFNPAGVTAQAIDINHDKNLKAPTDVSITDTSVGGTVTIPANTVVRFTNTGSAPHDIVASDLTWSTGTLQPGDSFERYFKVAGSYAFFDSLNASLTGTIVAQ